MGKSYYCDFGQFKSVVDKIIPYAPDDKRMKKGSHLIYNLCEILFVHT